MGEFLFKAAYIINGLLRLCGRLNDLKFRFLDNLLEAASNQETEIQTIFNISNFYFRKDLKREIDANIAKKLEQYGLNDTVKYYFERLSREAQYLLDICDLYTKTNNANFKSVVEFVIVHSSSGQLPHSFARSKECVIENLSKPTQTAAFSILYEQERAAIMDGLICDTQDVEDCFYLLVSSFQSEDEGYIQYDDNCRGTYVARNMKKVINKINDLPDKKRKLFVIHQAEDKKEFTNFNETRTIKIEESRFRSKAYILDTYLLERERVMENKEIQAGITHVQVNMNGTGNVYAPNNQGSFINATNVGDKIDKEFIEQLEAAISHINKSEELDEEQKKQLESIMNDAKNAENEQSEEKRNSAKKAFGYVKTFLTKGAPKLITTLASLTKIAQFFGIGVG